MATYNYFDGIDFDQPENAEYTDLNDILDTVPTDPTIPTSLLTGMPWVSADRTDVQRTWRKYGWVPPSEAKRTDNKTGG